MTPPQAYKSQHLVIVTERELSPSEVVDPADPLRVSFDMESMYHDASGRSTPTRRVRFVDEVDGEA